MSADHYIRKIEKACAAGVPLVDAVREELERPMIAQKLAKIEQAIAEIRAIVLEIRDQQKQDTENCSWRDTLDKAFGGSRQPPLSSVTETKGAVNICPYLAKAQTMWSKENTDIPANVERALAVLRDTKVITNETA